MKTVWKFQLRWTDQISVQMPESAKILSAQIQNGEICLWALVFPENTTESRRFRISGTGHPITEKVEFIDTVQVDGLVFHVFEVIA